jgi:hypothetical protein
MQGIYQYAVASGSAVGGQSAATAATSSSPLRERAQALFEAAGQDLIVAQACQQDTGRLTKRQEVLEAWVHDFDWPEILRHVFHDGAYDGNFERIEEWSRDLDDQVQVLETEVKDLETAVQQIQNKPKNSTRKQSLIDLKALLENLSTRLQEQLGQAALAHEVVDRHDLYANGPYALGGSAQAQSGNCERLADLVAQEWQAEIGDSAGINGFKGRWGRHLLISCADHLANMLDCVTAIVRERQGASDRASLVELQQFAWRFLTISGRIRQEPSPLKCKEPLDFNGQPGVLAADLSPMDQLLACDLHPRSQLRRLADRAALLALEPNQADEAWSPDALQAGIEGVFKQTALEVDRLAKDLHHDWVVRLQTERRRAPVHFDQFHKYLRRQSVTGNSILSPVSKQGVQVQQWPECLEFENELFYAIDAPITKNRGHAEDVIRVEKFVGAGGQEMWRLMLLVARHKQPHRTYFGESQGNFHGLMGIFEVQKAVEGWSIQTVRFGHALIHHINHLDYDEVSKQDFGAVQQGLVSGDIEEFYNEFVGELRTGEKRFSSRRRASAGGSSSAASEEDHEPAPSKFVTFFTSGLYAALWFHVQLDKPIPKGLLKHLFEAEMAGDHALCRADVLARMAEAFAVLNPLFADPTAFVPTNLKDLGDQKRLLEALKLEWPQKRRGWSDASGAWAAVASK